MTTEQLVCRHCQHPFMEHHYVSIWMASAPPDPHMPGDPGGHHSRICPNSLLIALNLPTFVPLGEL